MRRGGVFFGFMLVVIGGLLLAANFGFLTIDVWSIIWPTAVILFGAWIVFGSMRSTSKLESLSIPSQGASAARLTFRHGAGRLLVGPGATFGAVLEGDFSNGVNHHESMRDGVLHADVSMRVDVPLPAVWMTGHAQEWSVRLTEHLPLALVFEMGANEAIIDLAKVRVTELALKTGASSTDVMLPAAGRTSVTVSSGAASVKLRVPEGVAARVTGSAGLASIDVAGRFPKVAGGWESPGFSTATDRVEIHAEVGVGAVEVL